jgi:hypothetical protein
MVFVVLANELKRERAALAALPSIVDDALDRELEKDSGLIVRPRPAGQTMRLDDLPREVRHADVSLSVPRVSVCMLTPLCVLTNVREWLSRTMQATSRRRESSTCLSRRTCAASRTSCARQGSSSTACKCSRTRCVRACKEVAMARRQADTTAQVDELVRKTRPRASQQLALDDIPSAVILSRQVWCWPRAATVLLPRPSKPLRVPPSPLPPRANVRPTGVPHGGPCRV